MTNTIQFINYLFRDSAFYVQCSKKTAEIASLCSNNEKIYKLRLPDLSALETICFIGSVLITFPAREENLIYELKEKIRNKIIIFRKQGKWSIVEEIISTRNLYPAFYFEILEKYFSLEDIYGNLLPCLKRLISSVKLKQEFQVTEDRRPVTKKVFRRGYKDHGNLPISHWSKQHEIHCLTRESKQAEKIEVKEVAPPSRPVFWTKRGR